jgi:hypothetical protein
MNSLGEPVSGNSEPVSYIETRVLEFGHQRLSPEMVLAPYRTTAQAIAAADGSHGVQDFVFCNILAATQTSQNIRDHILVLGGGERGLSQTRAIPQSSSSARRQVAQRLSKDRRLHPFESGPR